MPCALENLRLNKYLNWSFSLLHGWQRWLSVSTTNCSILSSKSDLKCCLGFLAVKLEKEMIKIDTQKNRKRGIPVEYSRCTPLLIVDNLFMVFKCHKKSKSLFWPINSMWSTHLLIKIHNKWDYILFIQQQIKDMYCWNSFLDQSNSHHLLFWKFIKNVMWCYSTQTHWSVTFSIEKKIHLEMSSDFYRSIQI